MFDIEMQEAIELGLDTNPEIAKILNTKRWEIVLDMYFVKVISPGIDVDSGIFSSTLTGSYISADDTDEFLRDHVISFLMGIVAITILIVFITQFVVRSKSVSDPIKELDYKQSRFYRKD